MLDAPTPHAATRELPAVTAIHTLALRLDASRRQELGIAAYCPHPKLWLLRRRDVTLVLLHHDSLGEHERLLAPFAHELAHGQALLLLVHEDECEWPAELAVAAALRPSATDAELWTTVQRSFDLLDARAHADAHGHAVQRYEVERGELVDIARVISTERNVDELLRIILEKCRLVTQADAGSVYVLESQERGPMLRFKFSQNDSVRFDSAEFTMPISTRSIAGAAALDRRAINLANVEHLPVDSPFGFDRSFDARVGYTTRSMLTLPLISQQDEVIGVIQLINRKREPSAKIRTAHDADRYVVPFDAKSEALVQMVAAQAGVSLENALLYQEIQGLFASFVHASVEAIEARDPTTSGHSRRVADLTVALAKVVDQVGSGSYHAVRFHNDDLRELEYASLLHDFGKIGVREKVLVKGKKLYDERLELVLMRCDAALQSAELEFLRRRMTLLEQGAHRTEIEQLEAQFAQRRSLLARARETILHANEPTVLAAGDFTELGQLAQESFTDFRGRACHLLDADDLEALSIQRGTLTSAEYTEISSHVSHTFRFLSRIPWGKKLRRVPLIAGAHHERLNGTGYPNRLRAEEIPVQAKMMSIADIFDALTASDRPYKRAVPVDRALDILDLNVRDGHIDGELVSIFREARVWEQAWAEHPPPASRRPL